VQQADTGPPVGGGAAMLGVPEQSQSQSQPLLVPVTNGQELPTTAEAAEEPSNLPGAHEVAVTGPLPGDSEAGTGTATTTGTTGTETVTVTGIGAGAEAGAGTGAETGAGTGAGTGAAEEAGAGAGVVQGPEGYLSPTEKLEGKASRESVVVRTRQKRREQQEIVKMRTRDSKK